MNDTFGKNPLNYALEIGDKNVLETIFEGLYNMDVSER